MNNHRLAAEIYDAVALILEKGNGGFTDSEIIDAIERKLDRERPKNTAPLFTQSDILREDWEREEQA